ncbi:MAG: GNAT family N-acetyltransferase [Actinomycetota bacterium]|nr:GNAT family N-acetyltransferase [Actinomycetota bacterium]
MADDYDLRALTADDVPAFADLVTKAFLADWAEEVAGLFGGVFEPDRSHGVFVGDRLIGGGQILSRDLRVPGGWIPFAGVTYICVAADHRRRGVLSRIMRAQLHGLHDAGAEPIAALWASEAAIYGRFGFGTATEVTYFDVIAKSPFRSGVDPGSAPVRELSRAEALPVIKALYERESSARVGALSRDDAAWTHFLHDTAATQAGATTFRFAVHPDGYAIYRAKGVWGERGPAGQISAHELVAATPQAHAALLRHLLDMDLATSVTFKGTVDDPAALLLHDPRAAVRSLRDALYIRLVDVDRGLRSRRYAGPVDAVIDVTDEFCPWNTGRWRMTVDSSGAATVTRTDDAPDVSTTTTDLGAAFLGGTRLTTLAAAGRVQEHTPGAVAALSSVFLTDRVPACLEIF